MEHFDFKFDKYRSFGDVFNDTFSFIKMNLGKLLLGFIYFVLPIALIQGLVAGFVIDSSLNGVNLIENIQQQNFNNLGYSLLSNSMYLILYSVLFCYVLNFIKLAKSRGADQFELKEVFDAMQGSILSTFGAMILMGILSFIGLILCILPGIYLFVVFAFVLPLIILGEQGLFEAISSSFKLIKNNWWKTFLILFVLSIIIGVIGFIFSLPLLVYSGFHIFSIMQDGPATAAGFGFSLFSVIAAIGSSALYMVLVVGTALMYYSYNEEKNNAGFLKDL